MAELQDNRLRTTAITAAAASVLVVEPAVWLARRADHHLPFEESPWFGIVMAIAFGLVPVGCGLYAARRHPRSPFFSALVTSLVSTLTIIVVAVILRLIRHGSVPLEHFVKYGVYLWFTAAVAVIAAYLYTVITVRRQPNNFSS